MKGVKVSDVGHGVWDGGPEWGWGPMGCWVWMEMGVPWSAGCGEGGPRATGCWGRVESPMKCCGRESVEWLDGGRVPVVELEVPVPWGARERGVRAPASCDTVCPQVSVGEGSHPSRVKVHGPGVEKTGLKANEPTYFTVDCSEAGQGGCRGGGTLGTPLWAGGLWPWGSTPGPGPLPPALLHHPWIKGPSFRAHQFCSCSCIPGSTPLMLHPCSWSIIPAPGPGLLGLHPHSCTCIPAPLSLLPVHQS